MKKVDLDNAAAVAELEAVEASGTLARAIKREILRLKRASQPEPQACTADGVTVCVGDTVFRAAAPRFESRHSASGKSIRKPRILVEQMTISEMARATYSGVVVRFLEDFSTGRLDQYRIERRLHGTQYFATRAAAWAYVEECAKRSLGDYSENVKEARKLLDLTKKAISDDRKTVTRKMDGVRRRARGKRAA